MAIVAAVIYFINWDFIATLDFGVIWEYRVAFAIGLLKTLSLTGIAVALGVLAGFILAAAYQAPSSLLRWASIIYVEVLRNTPLVVQLFWIHFALPQLTGISTTAFQSGLIAMTLQSSAYLADVARSGIQAIPKGQWEAAAALGLPAWSRWIEVALPQAIKIVIPPLANIAIGYFKASAMLVLLGVGELMTVAGQVANYSFKPIETFTFVGLIYLVLGYTFSTLTYRLEAVYKRSERPLS